MVSMWFFLALLYAILMAVVIVFDRYIVKNIFTRPMQGLFITIPTSSIVIICILPLASWPGTTAFFLSFATGAALLISQACYFFAMAKADHAGDLSAIEASYPALVAIASIYLGNYLEISEWIGIIIVISSVIAISWGKVQNPDFAYLAFLGADIVFLAIHGLLANHVLQDIAFLSFYLPYSIAIVLCGMTPFIVSKTERAEFTRNWKNIQSVLPQLGFMEAANIIALVSATYALGIGHPALVTVVMTTYPAMVFLMSEVLSTKYNTHGFSKNSMLYTKLLLVLIMVAGLSLIV